MPRPPAPLRFRAPLTRTGHGGDRTATAVAVRDVVVPGRLHVDHLDLAEAGRLLVAGPNGAGKSTLLAVLAGRLRPARGTVWHRDGLRVGLLPQDARFRRPQLTCRQIYAARVRTGVPLVELGPVAPRDVDRPVGQLSTGRVGGWPWRCWWPTRRTCCWTSPPTTSR